MYFLDLFKKKKQEEVKQEQIEQPQEETFSCLSYCVDDDGEIYIDVNLKELTPECLIRFSKIMIGMSSLQFHVETIETLKNGLLEHGREDLFELFVEQVLSSADLEGQIKKEDEPCIKPSDMF